MQNVKTRPPRHPYIEEDQRRPVLLDQRPGLVTIASFDDGVVVGPDSCMREHAKARFVVGDDHGAAGACRGDRGVLHKCASRGVRASAMKAAASFAAPECFFSTATTPAVRSARVSVVSSSLIVTTTTGSSPSREARNRQAGQGTPPRSGTVASRLDPARPGLVGSRSRCPGGFGDQPYTRQRVEYGPLPLRPGCSRTARTGRTSASAWGSGPPASSRR